MALRVNSFFCFDLRSGCLAIAIAQVTLGILGLAAGAESGDYVGSDVTLAVVGFLCGLLLGAAYYKKSGILFILWLTFAMISIIAECIFAIVAIALVTQSNTILAVIPIILLLHIGNVRDGHGLGLMSGNFTML